MNATKLPTTPLPTTSRLALVLAACTLALACTESSPPAPAAPKAATPPAPPSPPAPAPSGAATPAAPAQDNSMANSGIPQGPGDLFAIFKTSAGDIVVKLFEKDAPKTIANFVGLATGAKEWTDPRTGSKSTAHLYDGTVFHRVIPQFMIQGGDPLGQGIGGPGYKFEDEFQGTRKFDKPGILAMANSGPNTNGSQFFITEVPTPHLNGRHTIFGEVTRGFELVPRIARAGNAQTKLNELQIVRSVTAP